MSLEVIAESLKKVVQRYLRSKHTNHQFPPLIPSHEYGVTCDFHIVVRYLRNKNMNDKIRRYVTLETIKIPLPQKTMTNKNKEILWEELSWKAIKRLTKSMKMVIVPIGACEQHGPHLPLAVDTIDCYEVAKRVSARTGVPVIPPVTYGCSQSHGDFPGTLSIRPETMMRMICDIVEWLYRSGIGKSPIGRANV